MSCSHITPFVAVRWPTSLLPSQCSFGRDDNSTLQVTPRTRQENVIMNGRPLWKCTATWNCVSDTQLNLLRYFVDMIKGFRGSVIVWDFTSPFPAGTGLIPGGLPGVPPIPDADILWFEGATDYYWADDQNDDWAWEGPLTSLSIVTEVEANACAFTATGFAPSSKILKRGDYIQVARRLYIAAKDCVSDANGDLFVTITTPLVFALKQGDPVFVWFAGCEMRLVTPGWTYDKSANDGFHNITLEFLETHSDYT